MSRGVCFRKCRQYLSLIVKADLTGQPYKPRLCHSRYGKIKIPPTQRLQAPSIGLNVAAPHRL